MPTFKSRDKTVTAVQFDGTNIADIQALLQDQPSLRQIRLEHVLVFENSDLNTTYPLPPGWWVSRDQDGFITLDSPAKFEHLYDS